MRVSIDPERPFGRWLEQTLETLQNEGVVLVPTDSGYGLVVSIASHNAIAKLKAIKETEPQKYLTLLFPDLKRIGEYAGLSDYAFKTIKRAIPGPYTFILKATKKVPKLFENHQKTLGVRVPDHSVVLKILRELGEPLVHSSFPAADDLYADPIDIEKRVSKQIDLLLDVGLLPVKPTTVVDLSQEPYTILRQGKGDASWIVGT
jgi:tRNA threonylcarbamoyl adenosine modification protein (Sua5/YciO/YrdC/YwlC family)